MPINISIEVSIRRHPPATAFIRPDTGWVCACVDGVEDCTRCDGMGIVNYNLKNMKIWR